MSKKACDKWENQTRSDWLHVNESYLELSRLPHLHQLPPLCFLAFIQTQTVQVDVFFVGRGAVFRSGHHYVNQFCWLFTIKDHCKICSVFFYKHWYFTKSKLKRVSGHTCCVPHLWRTPLHCVEVLTKSSRVLPILSWRNASRLSRWPA